MAAGAGVATLETMRPDGAALVGVVEGAGPPILLVTGLGGTSAFWAPLTARVARHGRVARFDQPGIGASTRGAAAVDVDRLAADALAVADAAGFDRFSVVGHSLGGCIAQRLALSAPQRVSRVVLSGTWSARSPWLAALFAHRRGLLLADPAAYAAAAALSAFDPDWLNAHIDRVGDAAPTGDTVAIVRERIDALLAFDGAVDLPRLAMPALVLGAVNDSVVPPFHQRALADALPDATLTLLPCGGHFYPLTHPDETAAAIVPFLNGTATTD